MQKVRRTNRTFLASTPGIKLFRNVWVCMNILDCTQPILLTVQSCHCRNLTVFAVIHYYLTDSVHISVAHMFVWQHLSVCVMLATESVYN